MTPKSFLSFAAITGVAALGAVWAVIAERNATALVRPDNQPMFPQLAQRIGAVGRIKIETTNYQLVLERRGNAWQVANKGAYPARAGSVSRLIGDIASLRPNEAKTANPSLYSRVNVEEPGTAGTKAKLITVESEQGEMLARFVMGKQSASMGFSPLGGTFIRRPNETQTWLAEGSPIVPDSLTEWFEQIVHVPGTKVTRVAILEGDEVVYDAAKSADDAIRYALVKVDKKYAGDDKVVNDSAVKRMPLGIISVSFEDVRAASDVKFAPDARTVRFETDDGLTLDVKLGQVGDETWVRYAVSAAPGNAEAATQAKEITERTANWAFKLPSHKVAALTTKVEELVEDPPPPEQEQPQGFQFPPGMQLPPGFQLPPGMQFPPGGGPVPLPPGFQLPPGVQRP